MFFLFFLFFSHSIYSEHFFEEIQKSINGEIYLLRKELEEPIFINSLYDFHFRKFDWNIHKNEFKLNLEKDNQNKKYLHWNLIIPIKEQSYLHFIEAKKLWEDQNYKESLFLYKSLLYSKEKQIILEIKKILEEKLYHQNIKQLYNKIDPVLLYNLEKDRTEIYSQHFGFNLTINSYWNFYFSEKNEWFFFISNSDKKRIFTIYNNDYILYFYLLKLKLDLKQIEKFLFLIDKEFSWNPNTKIHYNYKREKLKDNLFYVSYIKKNQLYQYYELFLSNLFSIIYLRIYALQEDKNGSINFINSIKLNQYENY